MTKRELSLMNPGRPNYKRGKVGMDVEPNSIASGNATTTSAKKHSSSILQNLKKKTRTPQTDESKKFTRSFDPL